jgi:uncharacterized Zn-binding protein involved in type VI secretion
MGLQSISTLGDRNSHGGGILQSSQIKVYNNSLPVTLFGDQSSQDLNCSPIQPVHCSPNATEGSLKVFIQNRGVHRRADKRACGAVTVPPPGAIQKVFAG